MQLCLPRGPLPLDQPLVMGVLNVTPDSFSDGGRFLRIADALDHAQRMVEAGAALIDVGGESTRPGAQAVTPEEERRRVLPVVEALARLKLTRVSVDTSQPALMREAVAAGAELINDVRALRLPGALEAARESGAAVCLMHMQGEPASMQERPQYAGVVTEVGDFLTDRVRDCETVGLPRERLCLDPGFGFGKTLAHNLALLHGLPQLAAAGLPLLVGLSRKRMAAELGGDAEDRRVASATLAAMAVLGGAHIVRAHDVAETLRAVRVAGRLRAEGFRWSNGQEVFRH